MKFIIKIKLWFRKQELKPLKYLFMKCPICDYWMERYAEGYGPGGHRNWTCISCHYSFFGNINGNRVKLTHGGKFAILKRRGGGRLL